MLWLDADEVVDQGEDVIGIGWTVAAVPALTDLTNPRQSPVVVVMSG